MRTAKIGPDLSLPLCQFISYFGFLRRLPLTTRFQTSVPRSPFPAPPSRFSDILLVRFFRSSTLTESLAKAKDFQDCLFPGSIADWLVALQTDEKSNLSTESFIVNCKTNLRLIIVRKKNEILYSRMGEGWGDLLYVSYTPRYVFQDRELFLRYSVLSPQSTGPKLNKI